MGRKFGEGSPQRDLVCGNNKAAKTRGEGKSHRLDLSTKKWEERSHSILVEELSTEGVWGEDPYKAFVVQGREVGGLYLCWKTGSKKKKKKKDC